MRLQDQAKRGDGKRRAGRPHAEPALVHTDLQWNTLLPEQEPTCRAWLERSESEPELLETVYCKEVYRVQKL